MVTVKPGTRCPHCGNDLGGVESGVETIRCPECGKESRYARTPLWRAVLFAAIAAAAAGVLLLLFGEPRALAAGFIGGGVGGGVAGAVMAGRKLVPSS